MLGRVPDQPDRPGGEVQAVRLTCESLSVEVLSLGATLVDAVYDPGERAVPLLSALDDWTEYDDPQINHFVGSTMGRWCRNIKDTEVRIDGRVHRLTPGRGGLHAHGGPAGFHRQNWGIRIDNSDSGSVAAILDLVSPAGHQGYPGEVHAEVIYRVRRGGTLEVGYRATTTEPTLLGMGNHVYWRIGSGPIDDLDLGLPAARRFEILDEVPTPESPIAVTGEHDFRLHRRIGDQGIDNYYIAEPGVPWLIRSAAEGLTLHFTSSEDGAGIYTGNHDRVRRRGVCLEFGGWPGAERRTDFPSPVLRPGEAYSSSWSLRVEETAVLSRP
jgi:aldose 1-epimerase